MNYVNLALTLFSFVKKSNFLLSRIKLSKRGSKHGTGGSPNGTLSRPVQTLSLKGFIKYCMIV